MFNMKKSYILLFISSLLLLALIAMIVCGMISYGVRRIENFPLFRLFTLGVSKPLNIEASQYPYSITWNKLDNVPQEYASTNGWFNLINDYSRSKLKKYMQENNLVIVPKDYALDSAMDIDALLQELEFDSQ